MDDAYCLLHGDCRERLQSLHDNSIDAIVTDPPYGLAFMGKKWDYDVPSADIWRECLRVLKPGGHLLAFAGTRTQHRMACNIEDAGFDIRDMIAWVYGSGFPKSLDVSKAIDRMDATEEQQRRRFRFTEWMRSTGVTPQQINAATGTEMGHHYTTHPTQPAIMTREHLEAVRHMVAEVPEWVERECDIRSVESRNMAAREVIGTEVLPDTSIVRAGFVGMTSPSGIIPTREVNITAPATDAARQWDGWGTALKPAMEPITVARKPLCGTVAENVLRHGTGGINVDGCRVGVDGGTAKGNPPKAESNGIYGHGINGACDILDIGKGRWPANLIHDGSDEVVGLLGSAARFFYCAKASKRDRGEGNRHPTVKPTDLMRYLCRLVTPPGGTVLDPFMGSGSTGKAAMLEGFRFIGIEREAEYVEIAKARIQAAIQFPHEA